LVPYTVVGYHVGDLTVGTGTSDVEVLETIDGLCGEKGEKGGENEDEE